MSLTGGVGASCKEGDGLREKREQHPVCFNDGKLVSFCDGRKRLGKINRNRELSGVGWKMLWLIRKTFMGVWWQGTGVPKVKGFITVRALGAVLEPWVGGGFERTIMTIPP